jgi:hypothetical protein
MEISMSKYFQIALSLDFIPVELPSQSKLAHALGFQYFCMMHCCCETYIDGYENNKE